MTKGQSARARKKLMPCSPARQRSPRPFATPRLFLSATKQKFLELVGVFTLRS